MDGDLDLDVVAASKIDSKITWYENLDGLGNFGVQQVISNEAIFASYVFVEDLDGDGDMDVISGSEDDHKVAWYENLDGLGNFGPQQIVSIDVETPVTIKAGDLDGDGDIDLISTDREYSSNFLVWFENLDGQGTFGNAITVSQQSAWGYDVFVSDLDGDGDMDLLATASPPDLLVWYENLDGQGTFSAEQEINTNVEGPSSVIVEDIDNDGDLDIVATRGNTNTIVWYENEDGLGSFGSEKQISLVEFIAFSIHTADFDGDGDKDLIAAFYGEDIIAWYENEDGLGNFGPIQYIIDDAQSAYSVYSGDMDGDGDIDALSSSLSDGSIAWYENLDGLGDFGDRMLVNNSSYIPQAVTTMDVDEDGDLDILYSSNGHNIIGWFENIDGHGTFDGRKKILTTKQYHAAFLNVVDLDNDGDLDILSASSEEDAIIVWLENLGGGNFSDIQVVTSDASSANSVFAQDLDNDGDLDVMSTHYFEDIVSWYENIDGQGTFGVRQILSDQVNGAISVTSADYDGDGDADIVSGSRLDDRIDFFENTDGAGNFGPAQMITDFAFSVSAIISEDIDNDGDIDLIFSRGNGVAWLENEDGQGDFSPTKTIDASMNWAWSVRAVDMDNDGDLDVIAGDRLGNTVRWFENLDGLGDFGPSHIVQSDLIGVYSVNFGDIDGDGDQDIVSASRNDSKIAWHQNILTSNRISGNLSLDLDVNGCTDSDLPLPNVMVISESGSESIATFTQNNGNYILYMNEGGFTTSLSTEFPDYYESNPLSYFTNFSSLGNSEIADFCLVPLASENDLSIVLYPTNSASPGFYGRYKMVYRNTGTSRMDGTATLTFDSVRLNFDYSNIEPNSETSNTLIFDFEDLLPFETRTVYLRFYILPPPTNEIDEILDYEVQIEPISGDYNETDNNFELNQVMIGSFDPNDIQVLEGEEIYLDEVDEYLHYIIRFQNTGTAPAINILVENELDPNLDWTTLQIEDISHPNRVEITNETHVEFIFNGINLPDSTNDEEGSMGYIAYKIKPINSLNIGGSMSNTADIFFDFNTPITTNTVITTVVENLSSDDHDISQLSLYPNPTEDILNISSENTIVWVEIYNQLGQLMIHASNNEGINQMPLNQLSAGLYFIHLKDFEGNEAIQKLIKE